MAKIKIPCPACDVIHQYDDEQCGHRIKCPHCKELVLLPKAACSDVPPQERHQTKRKFRRTALLIVVLFFAAAIAMIALWSFQPTLIHWPDRRPIGTLFLASNFYSSDTNPRGWFNDPTLDVTGPDGAEQFRKALMKYTDRSIEVLKRTGAQGVIVWDLEGEQYSHKTSYIGDPRLLGRLAPEMAAAADEFFKRLRDAGLKVGVTIRPQQLVFEHGQPRQSQVLDIKQILLEKIDYAKSRWGATLFYIDSNGGVRRPDEVWQLRSLAKERPDVLLIPEHHYLPYWAFSAPYVALRKGNSSMTARWAQKLFPGSFQVLDFGDADTDGTKLATAWRKGDILLFRAWFWSSDCELLENYKHK